MTDRIASARGLLEHAAKVPHLFDELMAAVVELGGDDVGLIATAMD